jgi:hypothetical protein
MGYVKTPEEIANIQSMIQNVHYDIQGLEVWFQTTPEFIESVLPPCFDRPAEPRAFAHFGVSESLDLEGDGIATSFKSAIIFVAARFGDVEGWYHLTMLLTGDMPITLGRELWGEAKKRAEITIDVALPRAHGHAERNGARVIEIDAEFGEDLGQHQEVHTMFDVKAFLNRTATDLDYDPIVFVGTATTNYETYHKGSGTLRLQSTEEDPCGTGPIVSIDRVTYGTAWMEQTFDGEHRLVGREGYLPYVLGRSYDIVRHLELANVGN